MSWLSRLFGGGPSRAPEPVRSREDFQAKVLDCPRPVIVDVWSDTCPPCRRLMPVLAGVAGKYEGRVDVVEINTAAEPALLAELEVRATPTLIIFSAGEELGRVTGFKPPNWFDEMIAAEFPEP